MSYPRWFPYPNSWLRALILFFSLIPLGFAVRVTGEILFYFLRIGSHPESWRLEIWLITTLGLIPIVVLSFIDRILWGNPSTLLPRWMPSFKSWGEGVWSWIVCGFSLLLCSDIYAERYGWQFFRYYLHDYPPVTIDDDEIIFFMVLFIIISAYFYQLRRFVLNKIESLKNK